MDDTKPTPPPAPSGPPSRKKWLIAAAIALIVIVAGSLLFYIMVLVKPAPNTTNDTAFSSTNPGTAPATVSVDGKKTCGITEATSAGPYYVSGTNAIMEGNLNYSNEPGEPIKIGGFVYAGEGAGTPIPHAKIEIWQADADGIYHPQGNGPASRYSASQIALRGYVLADGKGYYEFKTIYPGAEEDRARHIYMRVSADGHTSVTTQLILAKDGDKTTAANDSVGRTLPECNTITAENGVGSFNINLQ